MRALVYTLIIGIAIVLVLLILIIANGIKSIKKAKEKRKASKCPYYIEKED